MTLSEDDKKEIAKLISEKIARQLVDMPLGLDNFRVGFLSV